MTSKKYEINKTTKVRFERMVLTVCFCVAISLPLVAMLVGWAPVEPHSENRKLAEFPTFEKEDMTAREFTEEMENYYNDHFGLRSLLLRMHNRILVKWLGMSPSPDVVLGKDGWLFYSGQHAIDDYRVIQPLTEDVLYKLRMRLETRQRRLSSKNIKYMLVIVPEKSSLYPEYLPSDIQRIGGSSKLDQFMSYMKSNSNVNILDMRAALQDAKKGKLVYEKTGTHWNCYGALEAYRQIMLMANRWYPALKPTSVNSFHYRSENVKGAELALMLALEDLMSETKVFIQNHKQACPSRHPGIGQFKLEEIEGKRVIQSWMPDSKGPKLLMIHDSFGNNLVGLLATHWHRGTYVYYGWGQMQEWVKNEKPDIVIEEMVERNLWGLARRFSKNAEKSEMSQSVSKLHTNHNRM